jgi:hypothetical protein
VQTFDWGHFHYHLPDFQISIAVRFGFAPRVVDEYSTEMTLAAWRSM